ncbi:hypothetical protein Prudu_022316 [Prunus dulcis]|uniref:Uncharacterized protein n=1 Tax=Prunus dulcis TaxID=3755 RepID=A0A4Y1S102_PRUDU|nr:hypothetical protein Prudu_022316 [Prunus dulcis]
MSLSSLRLRATTTMADEFEFADKVPSSFDRRENWEGIESPGLTFLVQAPLSMLAFTFASALFNWTLFAWSKPALVVSEINRGPSSGNNIGGIERDKEKADEERLGFWGKIQEKGIGLYRLNEGG